MGRRGRRPLQTLHFTCYFEDGQWPSLHCSFRICFGIYGRIISVPTIRFYSVPTAEKPGKLSFRAFHDYRRINYEIIIIVR